MKIAEIRDPALFQRLVRKLMTAEHGAEYQVVDDAGGDSGLDGFNRSSEELHAIYCPTKPDSADYRRKIRSDLVKAASLRDDKGYAATRVAFITPQPLREPLQRELRDLARELGFVDGLNVAGEHLEALLTKHADLLDQFPDLSYPQVQATLGVMVESLNRIEEGLRAAERRPRDEAQDTVKYRQPFSTGFFEEREYETLQVLQSRLEADDENALFDLEQYRLELDDPVEDLAAASIEIDFEFRRLNLDRVVTLGTTAARRANTLNRQAEEAVFRAHAARALAMQGSGRDIDLAAAVGMSLKVGVNLIEPSSAEEEQRRVVGLYTDSDTELRAAFSLASDSSNLDAMYFVLMIAANCEVQKAIPHDLTPHLGTVNARLPHASKVVMATHDVAIRIARLLGQERLAMAYHNYANDLRPLGELQRAKAHAQRALDLAAECGYEYQVRLSERLLMLLDSEFDSRQEATE